MSDERIPIRDYIPADEPCVYCHETRCDSYFVGGYAHRRCFPKA
jgi:hypothetical protein